MRADPRRPIVAGNWKMHGTRGAAAALARAVVEALDALATVEVVLCPPYTALDVVARSIGMGPQAKTSASGSVRLVSEHIIIAQG